MVTSELGADERQALQRLYDSLGEIREIAQHMPVAQVMALLLVALHEGKSLGELARLDGAQLATLSRRMLDLGDRNRRMEEGYKLVEQRQNPLNLRENQYALSARGRNLIKAILKKMSRGK